MTIEQYEKATELLEEISSCKGYISQFQSAIDAVPEDTQFDTVEEKVEFIENRNVLTQTVSDLTEELHSLEEEFASI